MLHTIIANQVLTIVDTETATSHVEPSFATEVRDSAFSRLIGAAPAFIALVGLLTVWAS